MSTKARPLIAVVASRYSDFRKSVIDRIAARLDRAGYGVLCVAGRELQAAMPDESATSIISNSLYSQAVHYDVQGVIAITLTLGPTVSDRVIGSVVKHFHGKPLVSLGVSVPGIPSICIDNRRCMRELMFHMTRDPSRRRFVFIRGYPLMVDSCEREAVFREVLQERGLVVDEGLIIEGEFRTSPAFSAMDRLLARTHQIDAVVAANDLMAISAMHALMKHGLSVPGDVIVSGFDDRPEATESSPPITTIRHDFVARSDMAVDHLLRQIDGVCETVGKIAPQAADGTLLIRASSEQAHEQHEQGEESPSAVFDTRQCRDFLLASLASVPPPHGLQLDDVVDDIIELLIYGSRLCEKRLQPVLQQVHTWPVELRWWRLLSHQIGVAICRFGNIGLSAEALPRMSSLQSLIQGTVWSVQEKQRFAKMRCLQQQDSLHQQLTTSTNLAQIRTALEPAFRGFGVRRAWMVLYQTPALQPDEVGHLVFSLPASPGMRQPTSERFSTRDVLPHGFQAELGRGLLIQTPLMTGRLHYGYLLVDPTAAEQLNIVNLANSLSNAVCHCSRLRFLETQTEALENINRELTRLVNYDPLTGLSNRTRFQQTLARRFNSSGMAGMAVALLFLDLDGFKLVNDTLGHSVGDQLLTVVASRLTRLLHPGDSAARLGGDEFTVIIGDVVDDSLPQQTATRILQSLGEPYILGEHVINMTVSIGLAIYPEHGADVETLIRHADTAMYQAKALGKNCLCHYEDDLNRSAAARLHIDQAMRSGLIDGEFSLCYQPRIDLRSGEISAFEALLRWAPHARLDLVEVDSADAFISLAEQTGFILELDSFALEAACLQARIWQDQGLPVRIAVNMSVNQLQRQGIVERVESALARHRLDPACIEIELTEGAVMTDVENNIVKLTALRELGMKISVDDFGTGHSSLNYLKRLPVTSLKIDRSFVTESAATAAVGSTDSAIIEAIVALGKSMGFQLVAEGVETAGQSQYVADLGCDEAQGFYYARALEPAEATRYLSESRARYEEA